MTGGLILRERAREMRRNPTPGERAMRRLIGRDRLGIGFRRQHAIGDYIVDFVCLPLRLIVEVDGGHHNAEASAYDARRDAWLKGRGYRVLRFWNAEVFQNPDGVVEAILAAAEEARRPALSPEEKEGPTHRRPQAEIPCAGD